MLRARLRGRAGRVHRLNGRPHPRSPRQHSGNARFTEPQSTPVRRLCGLTGQGLGRTRGPSGARALGRIMTNFEALTGVDSERRRLGDPDPIAGRNLPTRADRLTGVDLLTAAGRLAAVARLAGAGRMAGRGLLTAAGRLADVARLAGAGRMAGRGLVADVARLAGAGRMAGRGPVTGAGLVTGAGRLAGTGRMAGPELVAGAGLAAVAH